MLAKVAVKGETSGALGKRDVSELADRAQRNPPLPSLPAMKLVVGLILQLVNTGKGGIQLIATINSSGPTTDDRSLRSR